MLTLRGDLKNINSRTDTRGRRHSVAVPLIPPPDGEKFEVIFMFQEQKL